MKSKHPDFHNCRGLAAMDPDNRRETSKKEGKASRSKEEINHKEISETTYARGFAAMDEEKRKEIARRGGSVSRRNRISRPEQIGIL